MAAPILLPPDCGCSFVSFLGRGTYGDVYLVKDARASNKLRALKIIDLDREPAVERHLIGEIKIMEMLSVQHQPSLLRMVRKFNMSPNGRQIGLVLQYCDSGDLQKYIAKQPGRKLTESDAKELMCQLACGLRVLKQNNIIHRDLKPANLLLKRKKNGHLQLKIADFGFAKALNDYKEMLQTLAGSPLYVAPEILLNSDRSPYSSQCDLWSIGIILHELLTSVPPFIVRDRLELQKVLREKEIVLSNDLKSCVSEDCVDLLSRLLQKDPKKRITWDDFFEHKWFGFEPLPPQTDLPPLDPIKYRIHCIRAVFNLAKRSSDFDLASQLTLFMEVMRALEKLIVSVTTLRESADSLVDQGLVNKLIHFYSR
jgi:serine/threonine protein kinase